MLKSAVARLRAATGPRPTYGLLDPATWVSVAGIVALVVFDGFGVADPSGNIKEGITIGVPVLLGLIALAKHLVSFQQLLQDWLSWVTGGGQSATALAPARLRHLIPPMNTGAEPVRYDRGWSSADPYEPWREYDPAVEPGYGPGIQVVPIIHQLGGPVHDPATCKLGKVAPVVDLRRALLARYLEPVLVVPDLVDWTTKVSAWPMLDNDREGDCVEAMILHSLQLWAAWIGWSGLNLADGQGQALYTLITGYNPADPSTDNGTSEVDALDFWRKTGVQGHKLDSYADVNPRSPAEVRAGVYLTGALQAGVALPVSAQRQQVWDVAGPLTDPDNQPGSWGGHGIPIVAFNAQGPVCITWAGVKQMTWAWFAAYCDELHAPVSHDWLSNSGVTPAGFDVAQLAADVAVLTA